MDNYQMIAEAQNRFNDSLQKNAQFKQQQTLGQQAIDLNAIKLQQEQQAQADQTGLRNALLEAQPVGGQGPGVPGSPEGLSPTPPTALPNPDRVALEYWAQRDPAHAQAIMDNIAKRAKDITDVTGDPEQAIKYVNEATGGNFKYAGMKGQLIQIKDEGTGQTHLIEYQPTGGKVTEKGVIGTAKPVVVPEKSRLYDLTLGKVILNGKPDDEHVPVRTANLGNKVRVWYKDNTSEDLPVGKSPNALVIAGAQQAQRSFKNEMDMRKEFLTLPEVKEYPVIEKQLARVNEAFKRGQTGGNMVAVDQTLITAFNKMLDESSVVRESEYARTASDLPWFNRIRGGFEKFQQGGAGLTMQERSEIKDMVNKFAKTASDGYNAQVDFYSDLASRYGFRPENIVRLGGAKADLSNVEKGNRTVQPAAKGGVGTKYTDPTDGSKWIQTGPDGSKKENWRRL